MNRPMNKSGRLASVQVLALEAGTTILQMTRHDEWMKEFPKAEREHLYAAREILLAHQPRV